MTQPICNQWQDYVELVATLPERDVLSTGSVVYKRGPVFYHNPETCLCSKCGHWRHVTQLCYRLHDSLNITCPKG